MKAELFSNQIKQVANEGAGSICSPGLCMDAQDSTSSNHPSGIKSSSKSGEKNGIHCNKMPEIMPRIKWGDLDDDVLLTRDPDTAGSDVKIVNVCGECVPDCRNLENLTTLSSTHYSSCDFLQCKLIENASAENDVTSKMPLENEPGRCRAPDRAALAIKDANAQSAYVKMVELDGDVLNCTMHEQILDPKKVSLQSSYCSDKNSKESVVTCETGQCNPCAGTFVVGSTVIPVASAKCKIPASGMNVPKSSKFSASVQMGKKKDDLSKSHYETVVIEDDSGESKERFRQRLWCFLFENLNRAIDELYLLCELECDIEQMKEATLVLEEASSDFKELISRVEEFENMKKSSPRLMDSVTMRTDHRRSHALSWEVRRMTTSPHRAEVLSSSLEAFKKIQQERESMHAAVHMNIQVPGCAGENCLSVKVPTKLNQNGDVAESVEKLGKLNTAPYHSEENSTACSQHTGKTKVAHHGLMSGTYRQDSRKEKESAQIVIERKHKNLDQMRRKNICSEKDIENGKIRSFHKSLDAWKEKRNWEEILSSPHRASSRISYSPSMNRKSAERARILHDKLMSPEKKKKTVLNLKKETEERHARAMKMRNELENERMQKLQRTSEKLYRVSEWKAVRSLKLKEVMHARHQRGESRHEAFLAQVVRRAGDESIKVSEVRFITSLNEENKKLILWKKLHDSETRRAERLQSMKTKQKEDMAREEAVMERRKHIEAEKLQRLVETQRKKEEAQLRREEERRAYAAAREAKAMEHQRRKEVRAKAQQEEAQLLAQKLAERLDESERRRKFYLEQIKERASMDFRDQISPVVRRILYRENQVKTLSSNSPEDSQANDYSSLVGSARQLAKRKIKKIRQRLMSLKYEFSESSFGGENANSISRSYIRTARAKIGRWLQDLKRLRQSRKEGNATFGQIITEIIKYIEGNEHELHASRQAGLLDFISSALPASHTSKPEVFQVTLRLLKLLRVTLSLPANRSYFLAQNLLPPIILLLSAILESYIKFTPSSVLSENDSLPPSSTPVNFESVSEVLDGFLWTVTSVIGHTSSNEKDLLMQEGLVELVLMYQIIHRLRDLFALYDRPQIEGSPFPSAIILGIELLKAITSRHRVISFIDWESAERESQSMTESREAKSDGLQSCLDKKSSDNVGVITNCSLDRKLFNIQGDPPSSVSCVEVAHEVVTSKVCEKDIISAVINPPDGSFESNVDVSTYEHLEVKASTTIGARTKNENIKAEKQCVVSLLSVISRTGLVCLPSLLTAVLLQAKSSEQVSHILPSNFQEVATGVLKVLNNLSLMDITLIQSMLARPDLKMEIFHLMSFLLSYCTANWKKGTDQTGLLLSESLLLLGHFSLFHPNNQAVLCWGKSPTILHKLCDLPFAFFSDAELMPILATSLIAACYGCEQNKCVVQQEISLDMLLSLLRSCRASDALVETGDSTSPDDSIENNNFPSETRNAHTKSVCGFSKTSRTAAKVCNSSIITSKTHCPDSKHMAWSSHVSSELMLHQRFPASFLNRAEQFFSHN